MSAHDRRARFLGTRYWGLPWDRYGKNANGSSVAESASRLMSVCGTECRLLTLGRRSSPKRILVQEPRGQPTPPDWSMSRPRGPQATRRRPRDEAGKASLIAADHRVDNVGNIKK